MKLCIPVCVSFDCEIPDLFQHDPYVLIGCGGYHSNQMKLADDTGKNVSQYNKFINEQSLIYWMHYNYDVLGNPDYVGLAHYRRSLCYEDWMLQQNSAVCSIENYQMSIYQSYCFYHVKSDFDFIVKVIRENFPAKLGSFAGFCNQQCNFGRNMFIMHRDNFMEYSDFMCKIIEILINDLLPNSDIQSRDRYQMRAIGFLLERMTGFWIYDKMMSKKLVPVITPVRTFDIQSPYQRPKS